MDIVILLVVLTLLLLPCIMVVAYVGHRRLPPATATLNDLLERNTLE